MKNNNLQCKPLRFIVISLLCMVLMLTIVPRAKTVMELSARKKELQKEKMSINRVNNEQKMKLEELKSPEAIERIAREQLGMVKKGEKVVVEVINHN